VGRGQGAKKRSPSLTEREIGGVLAGPEQIPTLRKKGKRKLRKENWPEEGQKENSWAAPKHRPGPCGPLREPFRARQRSEKKGGEEEKPEKRCLGGKGSTGRKRLRLFGEGSLLPESICEEHGRPRTM